MIDPSDHIGLVVSIAKKYGYAARVLGLPFEDLISEGTMGLMRSIESYEMERGAFSTYATFWIRHFIRSALRREARQYHFELDVNHVNLDNEIDKLNEPNLESAIETVLNIAEKQILRMWIFQDMSVSEIASVLGVTRQAIDLRIKTIIRKLRNKLEAESK